eukprot:TRINITY_DN8563_c0_g1_i2.p1 TRINITY_DN8563_c0_g1~~TRINITY_DN8563_c0_g1_i2.p1  ORF type:complete len:321 (+),score=73.07 TRINITY_DN8563_c0_g1_i2:65-1027(+)
MQPDEDADDAGAHARLAAEAVAYAQRVKLPAVMDSLVADVVGRRAEDPVEAVLDWAVARLRDAGRAEWARERVAYLAPPPSPPPPPDPEIEWEAPLGQWDYVTLGHEALLMQLSSAAALARTDGPTACDDFQRGLRLLAHLCRTEQEVFCATEEWALHQLGEASEAATDWASRMHPVLTAGAAGATVTGRTAAEMQAFTEAQARRLRHQDAVLRPLMDDDRAQGCAGPPKPPLLAMLLAVDCGELECHTVPCVVRVLCARRPYDATRRYAAAMQRVLTLESYRPIGAAVRRSAMQVSHSYARLLQGEGLLDISVDDVLVL